MVSGIIMLSSFFFGGAGGGDHGPWFGLGQIQLEIAENSKLRTMCTGTALVPLKNPRLPGQHGQWGCHGSVAQCSMAH